MKRYCAACLQADVHHRADDRRRRMQGFLGGVPRLQPLKDDQQVHVSEKKPKEENLRDKLEEDFQVSFEVNSVEKLHDHSEDHMDDGNDDCDLHLETVHKDQLIVSHSPNRINSKRIDTVGIGRKDLFRSVILLLNGVARPKDVEIHPEEVVVDPPAVEGEETHHQHHVAQVAREGEGRFLDGVVVEDQVEAEDEHDEAVADIAEHHSEEEGEGDRGEDRRVDLLVARSAVGVGDLLGDHGVAVCVEGSRRLGALQFLHFWRGHDGVDAAYQNFLLQAGQVEIRDNEMLAQLHLVQRFVDQPLLPQESPPGLDVVAAPQRGQQQAHLSLVQLQQVHYLLVLLRSPPQLLVGLVALSEVEERGAEGLHDPRDFLLEDAGAGIGVDKDDDLAAEVPESVEAEGVDTLQEGVSSRDTIDGLGEPELRGRIDHSDHRRDASASLHADLSDLPALSEKAAERLEAGYFRQRILLFFLEFVDAVLLFHELLPVVVDVVLVVIKQFGVFEPQLPGLSLPQSLQIIHIAAILFVVFLEIHVLFLERLCDGVDLDEEFVASLDLLEEGAAEGVADVEQVGVPEVEQLLDGVVVALPRQEQPEVDHLNRSESHGELSLLIRYQILRPYYPQFYQQQQNTDDGKYHWTVKMVLVIFWGGNKLAFVFRNNHKYSILFFDMLLRRSRKHLHGASNRNLNSLTANTFYQPHSLTRKEQLKDALPACATSYLKTRKLHKKEISYTDCAVQDRSEDGAAQVGEIQLRLRKIYQGRKNVLKAVDGWAFDQKGTLTRDAFTNKITEKIGYQPTEKEVNEIMSKYARNDKVINAQELISLIHGRTSGSLFNQTLFPFEKASKDREKKIQNLKENLKIYGKGEKEEVDYSTINKFLFKINSSISKMKDNTDGKLTDSKETFFDEIIKLSNYGQFQKKALKKVENTIDYAALKYNIQSHKSVDHLFLDPLLRKTHIAKERGEDDAERGELFVDKMTKTASSGFKFLRSSEKKLQFDPTSMLHINQQKTRFGKQFFPKDNSSELANTYIQGVSPNQKELILQTIKSQSDIHKQRYQNKLQKLRQYKQTQMDTIARKEEQAFDKDQGRLDRIRHEQQAYNYVNFLKKKWE